MTDARRRRQWVATATVLAVFGASILGLAPLSATAAVSQPAVSSNPIELAQALVKAQKSGDFRTNPSAIFDREIAPLAGGQAIAGCALDTRILQVLVLTVQNFGSLTVSDLQRPCIGSNLNCGAPTYSVHCLNPGEAIDFTSIGGRGVNGSEAATFELLRFIDSFVPRGTNAGQSNCRSGLSLANINQFSDSCNHQHVDFRNTSAPLNVTEAVGALPSLDASGAYTAALYKDYLSRDASSDDRVWWGRQLATGSPRTIVSDAFVNSDEYRLIRIDAAYKNILGRAAEDGGRMFWLALMQSGAITTDDIETQLYASDEFYAQHTRTDTGFAASLYKLLLHRNGSADEYAFWANLVAQNGRSWVIDQFWDSAETISERVSLMYTRYLGRSPDSGGLASWVESALRLGDSGLRSGLTSSDEYYARAQKRFG
ncbi:hypothetical protein B7R22_02265 [Subtercola boreus]|uniref:DUF4214 domain-containing protein n=1 Tax=Subtercola boreus TaxID=120213 RepID=A0A3E0W4J9_9MICO|nr:DUF4214 domain-containing protein [Subtercola boreus]RFA16705.1 hypothetical protein B7R22_02265 [Subtercola boreus]